MSQVASTEWAEHLAGHDPGERPYKCSRGCVHLYFRTRRELAGHRMSVHRGKQKPCVVSNDAPRRVGRARLGDMFFK